MRRRGRSRAAGLSPARKRRRLLAARQATDFGNRAERRDGEHDGDPELRRLIGGCVQKNPRAHHQPHHHHQPNGVQCGVDAPRERVPAATGEHGREQHRGQHPQATDDRQKGGVEGECVTDGRQQRRHQQRRTDQHRPSGQRGESAEGPADAIDRVVVGHCMRHVVLLHMNVAV